MLSWLSDGAAPVPSSSFHQLTNPVVMSPVKLLEDILEDDELLELLLDELELLDELDDELE